MCLACSCRKEEEDEEEEDVLGRGVLVGWKGGDEGKPHPGTNALSLWVLGDTLWVLPLNGQLIHPIALLFYCTAYPPLPTNPA